MKLVLVLGDQLSEGLSALMAANRTEDIVVMAEVMSEASYVPHHPKKIAFVLSAMRHFAERLRENGWNVSYTRLDDPESTGCIVGELLRRADHFRTSKVVMTEPSEWRLIDEFSSLPLQVECLEDDRFLCSHKEFEDWSKNRKSLRMEFFYREMRRKYSILMDDGQPTGGKWNFDHDNRKKAQPDLFRQIPHAIDPDLITKGVLELVENHFPKNFGKIGGFNLAVDRSDALSAMHHFMRYSLADFGETQDAMLIDDPFLNHSFLSPYLNVGLLNPLEVCRAAETEYRNGNVPLNSVEGFIRQILGWREFVRGIYFKFGPEYIKQNALQHTAQLPSMYWGAKTKMECMDQAIGQTESHAYAHHIQRLMITGNFALLAGVDPQFVHEWYLSVYVDAFEWVEAPNTIGMSQFADGGVVASKPYVSSGAYINRMSNYCKTCSYSVSQKAGDGACPFNVLYWNFLHQHREMFSKNPRMAQMYRTWSNFSEEHQKHVLDSADEVLQKLNLGEIV